MSTHTGAPAAADLDACASEPIHIPGAIQPHGVLLAVTEPGLEVLIASANAEQIGLEPRHAAGTPLATFLEPASAGRLHGGVHDAPRDDVEGLASLELTFSTGATRAARAHRSDGLLVVELEPADASGPDQALTYRRLVRRLDALRRSDATVTELCASGAREVKALTGYDRVMVYRFGPEWDGEVIAEALEPDLEPYLGLRYPAADIPEQARRLYARNPLRMIVDAAYVPVPLVPASNPLTGTPLDLSAAVLRSVSPVHCEYLRNMGVSASMSISLLDGDRLWGLIACHHRAPRFVPHALRLAAELVSQVVSARIVATERAEALLNKSHAYRVQSQLIDQMVRADRFADGLSEGRRTLADLIDCSGAAICYRDEITRIGDAPSAKDIARLVEHFTIHGGGEPLATDSMSRLSPPLASLAPQAAGVVAVPLSVDAGGYLFWFRSEQARTVTWAGEPAKSSDHEGEGARLSPRRSFAAWTERVRGRSHPWQDWEIEVASDFRTALVAGIVHQAAELERLNARLLEASQNKDRFLAMVSHELRNPLQAIVGWSQVASMDVDDEERRHALDMIQRNAQAQTRLIEDLLDTSRISASQISLELMGIDLEAVVRESAENARPGLDAAGMSLRTELAPVPEVIGDAGRLRQVLGNLIGNSRKYGRAGGVVVVRLRRGSSTVVVEVRDDGQGIDPADLERVFEPFRQGRQVSGQGGLGLGLSIVKSIVELHGGAVSVHSAGPGRGATFSVALPIPALELPAGAARDDDVTQPPVEVDLSGLRILVVDDHTDSAAIVARLLERCGARAVAVNRSRDALAELAAGDYQLLISDLDMPEVDGFALLRSVRSEPRLARLPAIALTGFVDASERTRALRTGYRQHVAKPVDPRELLTVVASVLGRL